MDDDATERAGRGALLTRTGIQVLGELTHDAALADAVDWAEVDVLLLDAWDMRSIDFDRYPGVAVARHVRQVRPLGLRAACASGGPGDCLAIVAISRHMPNPALSSRLNEAGVDLRFDRNNPQVCEAERLAELVTAPHRYLKHDRVPSRAALADLGMSDATRLNNLVDRAGTAEPGDLYRGHRKPRTDAERGRWDRAVRRHVAECGLRRPTGANRGGDRVTRLFNVWHLRTLIDLARGAHPDADDPRRRPGPP
ncbi:MAG: hypothetical protein ACT4RN_03630 [Pseudonocardia sp.]